MPVMRARTHTHIHVEEKEYSESGITASIINLVLFVSKFCVCWYIYL